MNHTFSPNVDNNSMGMWNVYSPKSHSLVVIEAVENVNVKNSMSSGRITLPNGYESRVPETVMAFDTVLVLKSIKSSMISLLERKVSLLGSDATTNPNSTPLELFGSRAQIQSNYFKDLEGFYPILVPTQNVTSLKLLPSWTSVLDKLFKRHQSKHHHVTIVIGSKNTGKSTFTRFLVNQLLNTSRKVSYLDLDLGQTEFSPPGMISLTHVSQPILGPPFTHPKPVFDNARYYGSSSPRYDPEAYLAFVQDLIRVGCFSSNSDDDEHAPLVINTMGWVKGMGYDLLTSILEFVKSLGVAMTVVEMTNKLGEPIVEGAVCVDACEESDRSKQNAFEHRSLAMVSYLFSSTSGSSSNVEWRLDVPLTSRIPMTIPFRYTQLKFLGEQVPNSRALVAMNASLVGIVVVSSGGGERKFIISPTTAHLSASHQCLGLGIIRSIDPLNEKFHLVTPVPVEILNKVLGSGSQIVLVKSSDMDHLPASLFVDGWGGSSSGNISSSTMGHLNALPYVDVGSGSSTNSSSGNTSIGGHVWRVRRNLLRRKNV